MKTKSKVLWVIFILILVALAIFVIAKYTSLLGFVVGTSTCTDSDGGKIYNTLGTSQQCSNGVCNSLTDYCVDSKALTEYSCSGRARLSETVPCTLECVGGVCT